METRKFEFKPFDRVLVRDTDDQVWKAAFYDQYSYHEDIGEEYNYPFRVVGGMGYAQCIPYEGNEHLIGTTDSYEPKPWKPELEETFFLVFHSYGEPFYVNELEWECTTTDEAMYRLGNCFRTREEAQAIADKLNAILKGKE